MGVLVDGVWRVDGEFPKDASGRFVRPDAAFRDWVTADGSAGPTGEGGFAAEPGRYHLYVSLACPWAHRTLIFRKLKGLEAMIGLSVVNWHLGEEGWTFAPGRGVVPDPVLGVRRIYELYTASRPRYTGRVSVPVLFDKARGRIVNNELADIIRMFNSAFDGVGAAPGDYYPAELRAEIDALNARIYPTVNNGVYRAGFAAQAGRLRRGGRRAVRNARRRWRRGSPNGVSSAAIGSPKPTGGCSRRWCASIRSMSGCSSAISGASPTIPISGDTSANCAPGRGSRRRSTSSTSSTTITAAFSSSIPRELCRWGRPSPDEAGGEFAIALRIRGSPRRRPALHCVGARGYAGESEWMCVSWMRAATVMGRSGARRAGVCLRARAPRRRPRSMSSHSACGAIRASSPAKPRARRASWRVDTATAAR